jgi:hypothetical protein
MKLVFVCYQMILFMHITACLWYVFVQQNEEYVMLYNFVYPYTSA